MKIGFFDSGLGGLTVMKAVIQLLPWYDYSFYGDTLHVPYGDKTEEEIYELTKGGVEHLFEEDCVLVIIACNTASAETLRKLQDTFLADEYPDRKILGVIIPMVEEVVACHAKRALLIATTRTVNSQKYEREFEKIKNAPELFSLATPTLTPLIEAGKIDEALAFVYPIIDELLEKGGESLILGCTHYALLREGIVERYKEQLMVFSQDQIIPQKIYHYLEVHPEIKNLLTQDGTRNIHLTKHTNAYDHLLSSLLGGHFISD